MLYTLIQCYMSIIVQQSWGNKKQFGLGDITVQPGLWVHGA